MCSSDNQMQGGDGCLLTYSRLYIAMRDVCAVRGHPAGMAVCGGKVTNSA